MRQHRAGTHSARRECLTDQYNANYERIVAGLTGSAYTHSAANKLAKAENLGRHSGPEDELTDSALRRFSGEGRISRWATALNRIIAAGDIASGKRLAELETVVEWNALWEPIMS